MIKFERLGIRIIKDSIRRPALPKLRTHQCMTPNCIKQTNVQQTNGQTDIRESSKQRKLQTDNHAPITTHREQLNSKIFN